jgi:hypothetical protein
VSQFVRPSRANPTSDPSKALVPSAHPPSNVAQSLDRGCRDCHTNETVWPWYTNVAPLSWWIIHHVNDGRREVNFSTWSDQAPGRMSRKLTEICEQVERRDMPMTSYLLIHPEAKLTDGERQAICDWARTEQAKIGPVPPREGRGRRERRD